MHEQGVLLLQLRRAAPAGASTLQRVVLTPERAAGIFSYNTAAGVQIGQPAAARGGRTASSRRSIRPSSKLLADIRAATATSGSDRAAEQPARASSTRSRCRRQSFNPSPTFRLDYDVSQKHRLTGSMNYRHINSTPDTTNNAQLPFPGFADDRQPAVDALDDVGVAAVDVRRQPGERVPRRRHGRRDAVLAGARARRCGQRHRQRAAQPASARAAAPASAHESASAHPDADGGAADSSREASTKVIEDTATWIKGKHSVTFGGSMVQADVWLQEPDARADGRTSASDQRPSRRRRCSPPPTSRVRRRPTSRNAQNLYAMLTGRITSITGDARINAAGDAYVPLGESRAAGPHARVRLLRADTWRAHADADGQRRPALRAGEPVLSDQQQLHDGDARRGLYGISGVGNLFKPGTLTGTQAAADVQYPAGTYAYNTDRNNFAPSVGFAWQPPAQRTRLRPADLRLAGRRQRDPRRRRDGVPAAGHVGLHRRVRRQPGHLGQPASRSTTNNLGTLPRAAAQPGRARRCRRRRRCRIRRVPSITSTA